MNDTPQPETTPNLARLHGFGYAPGSYYCKCWGCKQQFAGAKRSRRCATCAEIAAAEWESLTPDQQAERRATNAALAVKVYEDMKHAGRI